VSTQRYCSSFVELPAAKVVAAAQRCIEAIDKDRKAAVDNLLDEEIARAKRGFFGWFGEKITREQAESRLLNGYDWELHFAKITHYSQREIAIRLKHAAKVANTIFVTATDFEAIKGFYDRSE